MQLYIFELKKFISNKKNIYLFIIISSLFFLGLYFFQYTNGITPKLLTRDLISSLEDTESGLDSILDSKNISNDDLSRKVFTKDKEFIRKQIVALKNNDINVYNEIVLQKNKFDLSSYDASGISFDKNSINEENKYISLVQQRKLNFEVMPTV